MYVLLTHVHDSTEVPDPQDTTWVANGEQLGIALSAGNSAFQDYRDQLSPR